uniref:exodeoxyribonuclease VII large subunit n=1 Tax=Sphingosinicella sp. YJ22 TaxID=1104780 RepID=UPI002434E266
MRAPTPTAAAELAVPVRADLLAQVRQMGHRAERCAARTVERAGERLEALLRHWPEREELLAPQQQRLDDLAERLPRALRQRLDRARAELARDAGALRPQLLNNALARARERLATTWRMAELVHPERPLQRGFARIESGDGRTLTSAAAARAAGRLNIHFADGAVPAFVEGAVEPRRPSRHMKEQPGQPKLL